MYVRHHAAKSAVRFCQCADNCGTLLWYLLFLASHPLVVLCQTNDPITAYYLTDERSKHDEQLLNCKMLEIQH